MKKTLLMAALPFILLTACNENKTAEAQGSAEEMTEVKDVAGRRNFGSSHMIVTPQPCIMIATYDANQNPDVMMAAWGGQYGSNLITFDLSAHKTTENIRLKKAFTVSFATADDVAQSDYFGIVSGNDVPDKVARVGFTATPSPNVDAPIINEYKLTLECKVVEMTETGNGGARVIGQVVNWSADESVLDESGKIDLDKLRPIVFDSSSFAYRALGDSVGTAWNSGKVYQQQN